MDKDTMDRMTDAVLEYNGTPRDKLCEYPYNTYDSLNLIQDAERVVRTVLALAEK